MSSLPYLIFSMLLLGAITFCYRFSFISSRGKALAEKIPEDFLKLLAPAAFTAIVTNNLLSTHGEPEELQLKFAVAAVSVVVAYFTKSMMTTLVFGLLLLYFLQNYVF